MTMVEVRRIVLIVILIACLGGGIWAGATDYVPVVALRHTSEYRLLQWGNTLWGDPTAAHYPPGTLSGLVQDTAGRPVSGVQVLVASPVGETFATESDATGHYRLSVPPGIYRPVAARRGYADAVYRAPLYLDTVVVHPDRETTGVRLTLSAEDLTVPAFAEVEVGPAEEATHQELDDFYRAQRRAYRLLHGEAVVSEGYVYEPVVGEGPCPVLLVILPGPVLSWEVVPVPLADQGFVVVAVHPAQKMDIEGETDSMRAALAALREGQLSTRADSTRIGVLGGSFTSLHVYRLLQRDGEVMAALVLGGVADSFRIRRQFEDGTLMPAHGFDKLLIGLGMPNRAPDLYFRYSVRYHLDGLPPLCLIHGTADGFVPHRQSELLAEELEAREMSYELHLVPGLAHYFAGEETTLLLRITMDFFDQYLGGV
ncbi:MAG: carboxypeptidase regulatory-like domain-containing protein [Chloroflexota bacterium]|nr:carboxypeptidase regulatory-like domain-containing protein [Chloroflexota bacterium]